MSTTGHVIDPAGVDHPAHYNMNGSGIETIVVIRHLPYDLGAAFKYVVRWNLKDGLKDLNKACWYLSDLMAHPVEVYPDEDVLKAVEAHVHSEEDLDAKKFYLAIYAFLLGGGVSELAKAKTSVEMLIKKQNKGENNLLL